MTERLKLILRELKRGENLDLYLIILLAIVVGILGLAGIVRFEIISAAILATLGLLASSLLANRRSTDRLTDRVTTLDTKMSQRHPSLDDLFITRGKLPTFQQQLEDAQSIDICGMSLLAVAATYRGYLLDRVKRGCTLRLMLLDPDNEQLMQMVEPFIPDHDVHKHTTAISLALEYLNRDPALFNSDLVQIRLYDKPLAHALLMVNRNRPDARLRVEMYMRMSEPADSPGFYIHKQDEPRWFDIFATEFEEHWANATPYRPATGKPHSAGG